jgi:spore coat protein U-like protein
MSWKICIAATVVVGVVTAQSAGAATATTNLSASATVSTVCTMNASALVFGEVALSGATTGATPGTATITVTCTGGGAYTVGLDTGLHNVAAQRNLISGSATLAYGLFQDLAHGTVWTNAGAGLVSGTGNAAAQVLTVYGNIAAGLPVVSGSGTPYTDTVLVTLTY